MPCTRGEHAGEILPTVRKCRRAAMCHERARLAPLLRPRCEIRDVPLPHPVDVSLVRPLTFRIDSVCCPPRKTELFELCRRGCGHRNRLCDRVRYLKPRAISVIPTGIPMIVAQRMSPAVTSIAQSGMPIKSAYRSPTPSDHARPPMLLGLSVRIALYRAAFRARRAGRTSPWGGRKNVKPRRPFHLTGRISTIGRSKIQW
jgi:hypothetical protein